MRQRTNKPSEPLLSTSGPSNTLLKQLSKIDIYPKINEDVQIKTKSGGLLFLVIGILSMVLVVSQVHQYISQVHHDRIAVDSDMDAKLRINLNITFTNLPCRQVELTAMDISGEHQLDVHSTIHKKHVTKEGSHVGTKVKATVNSKVASANATDDYAALLQARSLDSYCGSCYGAEQAPNDCCNSCEDVKLAYAAKNWNVENLDTISDQCKLEARYPELGAKKGEGCNVEGFLLVSKVAGNFHVALGTTKSVDGRLLHQFIPSQVDGYNTSHQIHHLSFGKPFPGQVNPLSGTENAVNPSVSATGSFQYFVQIVPTKYQQGYTTMNTNQYTFTKRFTPIGDAQNVPTAKADGKPTENHRQHPTIISALPGVFFVYDLSPFVVERASHSTSFAELLTGLCAIVGGMLSIAGIVDQVAFAMAAPKRGF